MGPGEGSLKAPRRPPWLLLAAAISLAIAAGLAIAGLVFDVWQVSAYRMDDMIGWICLFAGVAIVLAIVSRARAGASATAGRRRVTVVLVALAAIPFLVVGAIIALLGAL